LTLRRFGILGDAHAEHEMLASALDHLSRQDVDGVLGVGDMVDGPGSVAECCRMLSAASTLVVRGNHDRWFLEGNDARSARSHASAGCRRVRAIVQPPLRLRKEGDLDRSVAGACAYGDEVVACLHFRDSSQPVHRELTQTGD
jgi:calcineurin-like phosphoesterase family protein